MIVTQTGYLVDEKGRRKAVLVPLEAWERILEALEELDDIRAYDEAKAQPSPLPFDEAMRLPLNPNLMAQRS